MKHDIVSLDGLSSLAPREFVAAAYQAILGRPPTPAERDQMLAALKRGDTRTWLVGSLRYHDEGRRRGVDVPGLHSRFLAQRLFRLPIVGPLAGWVNAIARLPSSLRHLRAIAQIDAERQSDAREQDQARFADLARRHAELSGLLNDARDRLVSLDERISTLDRGRLALGDQVQGIVASAETEARSRLADRERIDAVTERIADDRQRIETIAARTADLSAAIEHVRAEGRTLTAEAQGLRSRLDAMSPPPLGDVLEVEGAPLAQLARERIGLARTSTKEITAQQRYALFESVFYESPAVAAKQRVYLPYLDRELTQRWPFLDLGCGRGEFLRILREAGIAAIGVDVNPSGLAPLRADGFDVVERDILTFLESDRGTYSGASLLQVAEHLNDAELDRLLGMVVDRLAPGALLIVETPNPLSTFALGVFHTDATHIRPLPPERMRYEIEAAGFERARTLFQSRIPGDQFAGSDPRAYYMDYAVIASRSPS
jgi:O-antigen chain-terminating methyltransferase